MTPRLPIGDREGSLQELLPPLPWYTSIGHPWGVIDNVATKLGFSRFAKHEILGNFAKFRATDLDEISQYSIKFRFKSFAKICNTFHDKKNWII
jgi:hypothetical protein